ncbi:hypothetical protein [Lentzea nigeriaca]|uniref:hypothetical protein n=1 Tax=Lentzea nigeriaca TaxID=1128665 RepID=UPI00195C7D3C|nr:hypothetical protein [Lentzea nigeriaca]MBM7861899.1 hypothetical protein [Lentzea nigeriaca]
MSTTTIPEPTTDLPQLCDILLGWTVHAPGLQASKAAVADWFELCVKLLAPITTDPSHPEHTKACELAAEFSHDAIALRSNGNAEAMR